MALTGAGSDSTYGSLGHSHRKTKAGPETSKQSYVQTGISVYCLFISKLTCSGLELLNIMNLHVFTFNDMGIPNAVLCRS